MFACKRSQSGFSINVLDFRQVSAYLFPIALENDITHLSALDDEDDPVGFKLLKALSHLLLILIVPVVEALRLVWGPTPFSPYISRSFNKYNSNWTRMIFYFGSQWVVRDCQIRSVVEECCNIHSNSSNGRQFAWPSNLVVNTVFTVSVWNPIESKRVEKRSSIRE